MEICIQVYGNNTFETFFTVNPSDGNTYGHPFDATPLHVSSP